MPLRQKFLLLLASARVANLPSVVSNVWLGVALSACFYHPGQDRFWPEALRLALSGMLLYLSGNFLNDWQDRHWDAQHRPERALPQGAFTPPLYLALAALCALTGVALAFVSGMNSGLVAALIVLCILSYTRWHKHAAWTVLLMGLCRALLPLLFFSQWPLGRIGGADGNASMWEITNGFAVIVPATLALMLYIAALSLLARGESSAATSAGSVLPARCMLLASGLLMAWVVMLDGPPLLALLGLLPFLLWLCLCFTRLRRPVSRQVSALLAGIPLLDWVALLPLARVSITQGKVDAVAFTCLLLPPLAFLAGRFLQRLAAPT
jgi:4-hydroxybenzoate polyprenyltransferase